MHGFARKIAVEKDGKVTQSIGMFKNGKLHGYGKEILTTGHINEGLFEDGEYVQSKKLIQSYNPNVHKIS